MQKGHNENRPAPGEGVAYHLIFATSYATFLAVGAVQRLMPWQWRLPYGTSGRRSIFAEASRAAGTVTAFAFMG
jgi:hypothetical protein